MNRKGRKKLFLILLIVMSVKFTTYFIIRTALGALFENKINKFFETKKEDKFDKLFGDLEKKQKKQGKNSKKNVKKSNVEKQLSAPEEDEEFVCLTVKDYGTIKIKLFEDMFIETVDYFKKCVKDSKYNGVSFNKVIKDLGVKVGRERERGSGFRNLELNSRVHAFNGAIFVDELDGLSANVPSEFYIVCSNTGKTANFDKLEKEKQEIIEDNPGQFKNSGKVYDSETIKTYKERGGKPEYDLKVSIFGQVFSGMDVVKKIANAQTTKDSRFKKPIIVEKAEIKKYS